jgi:hypothetical protein
LRGTKQSHKVTKEKNVLCNDEIASFLAMTASEESITYVILSGALAESKNL